MGEKAPILSSRAYPLCVQLSFSFHKSSQGQRTGTSGPGNGPTEPAAGIPGSLGEPWQKVDLAPPRRRRLTLQLLASQSFCLSTAEDAIACGCRTSPRESSSSGRITMVLAKVPFRICRRTIIIVRLVKLVQRSTEQFAIAVAACQVAHPWQSFPEKSVALALLVCLTSDD